MSISRVLIFGVSFLIILSLLFFVAFFFFFFFFWGEWGEGGRVILKFCRKTAFLHSSFFISIVFLKVNLFMLMKLFISSCVTQKRLYLILISCLSPSIFSYFPVQSYPYVVYAYIWKNFSLYMLISVMLKKQSLFLRKFIVPEFPENTFPLYEIWIIY